MLTLEERRQAEFDKYRKVYRDYPNYTNRELRIGLTREWIEKHTPKDHSPGFGLLDVGAGRGEVVRMAEDLGIYAMGCEVIDDLCVADILACNGIHDLGGADNCMDLVTCTDVMEHILEEDVPAALSELARVARGPVLLTICHIPDKPGKYGPDQLHITVHPREWWEDKIREHMGAEPVALYLDRVNRNGTWFEVMT